MVNGTADPTYLGWPGRVCAAAHQLGYTITCYNLGIRRDTTADIARRWREECQARLPERIDGRVVFSFGANDVTIEDEVDGQQRLDTATSLDLARLILTQAKVHYPILWVGPPPLAEEAHNQRIELLCREFEKLATEIEVPYLSVYHTLAQSAVWMREAAAVDGAHPQAGGYTELAQLVQAWSMWWFH